MTLPPPPSPSAYYFISPMPSLITTSNRRPNRCIDPRQLFHHLRPPASDRASIDALMSSRDYKSMLCAQWHRHGVCDNGGLCRDAHGESELRSGEYRRDEVKSIEYGQNEVKSSDKQMCFEFSIYGSCSRGVMCTRRHAEPFETTFETTLSQTIANLRLYSTLTDTNQWSDQLSNNVVESKTTPIAASDSSTRIDAINVQPRRRKSTTTRCLQQMTPEPSSIDDHLLSSQHRSSRRRLQFE